VSEKMNVGEICNREVAFASEDMSLKDAAGIMRTEHVGSLVVVREAGAGRIVCGMLTDRDIAVMAVARDFDPQTLRVADLSLPGRRIRSMTCWQRCAAAASAGFP